MLTIDSFVLIVASYLWGSISPAYLVARLGKGIDLRQYGTGTVGGSNVGKQIGIAWMFAVGALDVLKGLLPPVLARDWGFGPGVAIAVSLATVIGHNWSAYLGFKGGRGIGTTVGMLLAWDVWLAMVLLFALAVGLIIKQGAPSSALGLILLAPISSLIGDAPEIAWGCGLLALIIFIKRLEANRLPLPRDAKDKRAVLWRRLWLDRDIASDQIWQSRGRID
jgi:glycerol-3-phosphate acyltransferase PlsY